MKIFITVLVCPLSFFSTTQAELSSPPNSFFQDSDWYCKDGFKRLSNQCYQMTPEEAEKQRILRLKREFF
jgi:hypothetical protein